MSTSVSPRKMKKIDPIAHELWFKFVKPYVRCSAKRTREIRHICEGGPMPGHRHPVIEKIQRNGAGMDGFNAAMMTWGYLAAMCRFHESKLTRR